MTMYMYGANGTLDQLNSGVGSLENKVQVAALLGVGE
jgi:hypothetical protein